MYNEYEIWKSLILRNIWVKSPNLIMRNAVELARKKLKSENIVILSGVRRSGKSSIAYLLLESLIKNKIVTKEETLVLNFEDLPLKRLAADELPKLIDIYKSKINPNWPKYIIWDEVSQIVGWEHILRTLSETTDTKHIVTSSGFSISDSEFSRVLSGRFLRVDVFPLSFKEYLKFKKINRVDLWKNSAKIKYHLGKYLYQGGFPKYTLTDEKDLLSIYVKTILYSDVINKYSIKNPKSVERLVDFLLSNISTRISHSNLSKLIKISEETVDTYLTYLENSSLMFRIYRFEFSKKKQMRSIPKIYAIDTGLAWINSFNADERKGNYLENLVFVELMRRYGLRHIFYATDDKSRECDFIVFNHINKTSLAIQATYEINEHNKKREINGLIFALERLKLKEGLILTYDQEDEIEVKDKKGKKRKIQIKPVWKWLLE